MKPQEVPLALVVLAMFMPPVLGGSPASPEVADPVDATAHPELTRAWVEDRGDTFDVLVTWFGLSPTTTVRIDYCVDTATPAACYGADVRFDQASMPWPSVAWGLTAPAAGGRFPCDAAGPAYLSAVRDVRVFTDSRLGNVLRVTLDKAEHDLHSAELVPWFPGSSVVDCVGFAESGPGIGSGTTLSCLKAAVQVVGNDAGGGCGVARPFTFA